VFFGGTLRCDTTQEQQASSKLYFELAPCAEGNYCHLVRDTLFPMFVALARIGKQRSFSENVLYCDKSCFKPEVFRVVSNYPVNIERYDPTTMHKLVFGDELADKEICAMYFPQFLAQLHERFGIRHDSASSHQKTVTIVHRSSRRAILNVEELNQRLERYCQSKHYRLYIAQMEKLSFTQQLQLMDDTDILIACHGAAMTNAGFMNRNGIVIEIFSYKFKNDMFQRYIEYCRPDMCYYSWNLPKKMCFTTGTIDKQFEYRYWRDQDVNIDPERLIKLLDKLTKRF
jgi:hypothetical protein